METETDGGLTGGWVGGERWRGLEGWRVDSSLSGSYQRPMHNLYCVYVTANLAGLLAVVSLASPPKDAASRPGQRYCTLQYPDQFFLP